jgi:hypothetical protein
VAQSDYEDLFPDPDDDLSFEEPQFPDDVDEDDELPGMGDDGGGVSRTFVILAAVLAVVFVILVAVGAALLLGGDSCDERCLQATIISETNAKIEADIRSSETAISIANTVQAETQVAVNATETQVGILQATATQGAVNTAVAATETQVSVDGTATQVGIERAATQTAIAEFTDTPTPTDEPTSDVAVQATDDETITEGVGGGDLTTPTEDTVAVAGEFDGQVSNLPTSLQGRTLTVCIFRDDGDGQFNPSSTGVTDANCTPAAAAPAATATQAAPVSASPVATSDGGAVPAQASATPATGGQPTQRPLNPIFATATAAAAAANGGGGNIPPSPTAEGSSFNSALYVPIGRSNDDPSTGVRPYQDGGDSFVGSITTDAQGRFVLPDLPAGEYWIAIGDVNLQLNVQDTVQEQVFTFPQADGAAPIIVVIPADAISDVGGPTTPTLGAIFQTATAVARDPNLPTPTPDTGGGAAVAPTELADTGLFDGEGGDVTTTDLLILALIGGVLIAVVFAARRMRSSV